MPPLYRLVEVGIYSLLNFLPLMVLALYPFRHRLRFSKTATVGLVVALSLVQIFLGWQAAFFSTNAGLLSAVSTLLYAAFYFFAVKVKVGKTGFTLLLLSNNASFIVITSKCLEGILFPSLAYESYRWSFSLCMLMTEAVVWGPAFYLHEKGLHTCGGKRAVRSGVALSLAYPIYVLYNMVLYSLRQLYEKQLRACSGAKEHHSSVLYKCRSVSGVLHRGTAGQRTAEKSAASGK